MALNPLYSQEFAHVVFCNMAWPNLLELGHRSKLFPLVTKSSQKKKEESSVLQLKQRCVSESHKINKRLIFDIVLVVKHHMHELIEVRVWLCRYCKSERHHQGIQFCTNKISCFYYVGANRGYSSASSPFLSPSPPTWRWYRWAAGEILGVPASMENTPWNLDPGIWRIFLKVPVFICSFTKWGLIIKNISISYENSKIKNRV